ncbi:GntR family transcriptional regulator [Corynebacterium sp. CCM 9185]|uniref:GntR family transcriptional regulator n=1 Tax=Corynebacterium marambiense TaxID=2765364 RepID=A0ABS0VTB0_9CORY|nr:GntR family transcriptional regulator [Corynebacterium marambiense]MBI9000014.1 GntR family transcriptional regulator [Corynebacterium marambiense]MCK7663366.1 GntR family transcriptional regulator [Corynebacterium marambiense]MCX7542199.1 GntR family transcriptional regulator [Corynebacterium marambiense]
MDIRLDPLSDVPIFMQLHDAIVCAIARSEIVPGEHLDSVRSVAASLGINPATVKKAYDLLQSDGIIETSHRFGSVVQAPGKPVAGAVERLVVELRVLVARARCQGIAGSTVLDLVEAELNRT